MVQIIVDSAADLEQEAALAHGITVLPLTITFPDGEYTDGVSLSRRAFYEKLAASKEVPHTSQVSPRAFEAAFKRVSEAGDTAVVITMSGKLSGTLQSAHMAADAFGETVCIVDSENVTVGERILVERAVALRDEGLSAPDIAKALDREKKDIRLIASLDTLEYLKKGGRISKTTALAGGLLSIKPVIGICDGEVTVLGKARGSKQSNNMLMQMIRDNGGVDFSRPIRLGYTGLDDALLRQYVEDSRELLHNDLQGIGVSMVGSAIGTHVGPGSVAVAFFVQHHS